MISLCRPFVTVRCIDNDVFLAKNMNIIFTVYRYCRATSHYSSFSPPFVARCFFSSTVTTWPDFGSRPPLTGLHDHTLDTPHSVGLLWTSDQPGAGTSTWQHTTLTTDRHVSGGILTQNPCQRLAKGPRLRPSGHSDRQVFHYWIYYFT